MTVLQEGLLPEESKLKVPVIISPTSTARCMAYNDAKRGKDVFGKKPFKPMKGERGSDILKLKPALRSLRPDAFDHLCYILLSGLAAL